MRRYITEKHGRFRMEFLQNMINARIRVARPSGNDIGNTQGRFKARVADGRAN
jgi:hypothetical protein